MRVQGSPETSPRGQWYQENHNDPKTGSVHACLTGPFLFGEGEAHGLFHAPPPLLPTFRIPHPGALSSLTHPLSVLPPEAVFNTVWTNSSLLTQT